MVTVASIVLSCCAILVSAAALGWKIIEWKRSGPDVEVLVEPTGDPREDPSLTRVIGVNHGRTDITAIAFGFDLPNGKTVWGFNDLWWNDAEKQQRIQGKGRVEWDVLTDAIRGGLLQPQVEPGEDSGPEDLQEDQERIKTWVLLATGRKVYAKKMGLGFE